MRFSVTAFLRVLAVPISIRVLCRRCTRRCMLAERRTRAMGEIRNSIRTPHHCRDCGGILRAVYVKDVNDPVSLECESCMSETELKPKTKTPPDSQRCKDRKTINDHAESVWHYATVNCPKCKAPVVYRQRPGKQTYSEMRCTACSWHPVKPPAEKEAG